LKKQVIVIGGGISGLSAAYYLDKEARERRLPLSISILEAGASWGGKISTVRQDGFVIEGGPDTFLAARPWGVELCRELGLEPRLHGTNPRVKHTYVLHRGRLQPLPEGLTMMIPTRIGPMLRTGLLSPLDKARMGLDFFIPPRSPDGDESLGGFVSRRLGRSAYERLIEPLMSGIYAGDGDQLSLQATFPALRELELSHGGLVRGALSARRRAAKSAKNPNGTRSAFLTPLTGLAEIVEALLMRLQASGVSLRLAAAASRVLPASQGYSVVLAGGEVLSADALVLATPAFASGSLLSDLDPSLAQDLRLIPYVSTATISLAYQDADLPRPLDGYGYVIPRCEGRRALACTWTSTKFPHRAPPGFSLLRVFIGRAGDETGLPWAEADLLDLARQELRLTLGIQAEPLLARLFRWEQAMPQYNLGHPERIRRIEAAVQGYKALALAGNAYHGIGIPDCIHSGQLAAERVCQDLNS
jgi:oxygen-dependent protoporphyrinogen oxidase